MCPGTVPDRLGQKAAPLSVHMPVYYARPSGVKNPPIILVSMEIFGLHEYIKDVTRRLAHLGAFAIAPNYYFRMEKDGVDLTKIADMKQLFPYVNSKADTRAVLRSRRDRAWAKSQGGDGNRLGIMGFCRGGRTVWHYSTHNPRPKAGVAFYGTLVDTSPAAPKSSIDLAAEVKEPVSASTAPTMPASSSIKSRRWKISSKPPTRLLSSSSIRARRMASTPTIVASYRKDAAEDAWIPVDPRGSRNTAC